SVNGRCGRNRTTRTGNAPLRTVTLAPAGRSKVRRPSQVSTARSAYGSAVNTMVEVGAAPSGRLNTVCALTGTSSRASTSGQTTGPPAENAYAVEPVGVAQTTASQPYRDSGRPSTATISSSIARLPRSTFASLSAQDSASSSPSSSAVTST